MWKQIFSGTKMNNLEPMVSVSKSGVFFNLSAVDLVGSEQDYVICFIDNGSKLRLGFCFIKTWMTGCYAFKVQGNSKTRRIGLTNFLKQNSLLEKLKSHGRYFPLKEVKDEIPDFEGSRLFAIEIG